MTGGPDAVVFDLDGVVTFTVPIHAAAWKALFDAYLRSREVRFGEPFRPFDAEVDYRVYIDGRPRYDGVQAFLASRSIILPYGDPGDSPTAETICGLGNRKNLLFQERLRRMPVPVDDEAVRLMRELRARGIGVGVASSSKNATLVLDTAGLAALFDAQVDGVLSERLGLRGKPAPDIFLKCLELLGVTDPGRGAVVEDAIAGVAAGRAAGFALVLGVDRGRNWIALREGGADWIIRHFQGLSADHLERYFAAREHARPNALFAWPEIARELAGRRVTVLLDYDGTRVPMVARGEQGGVSDEMRETIRQLAKVWPTIIMSGVPSGRATVVPELVPSTVLGEKVLGLHPAADWDRRKVVTRVMETLGLPGSDVSPVYIGDDVSEDAFQAVAGHGIGVLVVELPRPTAARYSLQNVAEVQEFLRRLSAIHSGAAA